MGHWKDAQRIFTFGWSCKYFLMELFEKKEFSNIEIVQDISILT
jgi:hypothetical protein